VNDPTYSRRAAAALILSSDALAAALLGGAVERAGFRAAFPQKDETLGAALIRVKATHVLLDAADLTSRDDAVIGPALMTGSRLFFFGGVRATDEVREFAGKHQARLIILPDDINRLREILTRRPSPKPHQMPAD
jgi:hypothetical protein